VVGWAAGGGVGRGNLTFPGHALSGGPPIRGVEAPPAREYNPLCSVVPERPSTA
jgi:hypothetical protein